MRCEAINNSIYANTLFYLFKITLCALFAGCILVAIREYNHDHLSFAIVILVSSLTLLIADSIAIPIKVSNKVITYSHLWRTSKPHFRKLMAFEAIDIFQRDRHIKEYILIGVSTNILPLHLTYSDNVNNLSSRYENIK